VAASDPVLSLRGAMPSACAARGMTVIAEALAERSVLGGGPEVAGKPSEDKVRVSEVMRFEDNVSDPPPSKESRLLG